VSSYPESHFTAFTIVAPLACRNFQTFDNTQASVPPNYDASYAQTPSQGLGGFYDPTAYTDTSYGQDKSGKSAAGGGAGNEFDDEPPLLEGEIRLQMGIQSSSTCEP